MTKYLLQKMGPLDVIEVPPVTPVNSHSPTIVLLHGYGADAQDLAPVSHVLKTPSGTRWIIPNGPLPVEMGAYFSGRAWAPINMAEWQRATAAGRPRNLSDDRPPELIASPKLVSEMLDAGKVDPTKIIFAGFSQGAMLATHMMLTSSTTAKGLLILSGALINQTEWREKAKAHGGFKFFQCHGRFDEVLSFQGAESLEKLLIESGLKGKLLGFDGGHEIPPLALQGAQNYIFDLFPKEVWENDDH